MSVRLLSTQAISDINNAISHSLSETEKKAVSKIIEEKLIFAIKESVQNCSTKAAHCCGPESDIAHKIAKEFKDSQNAIIANLMSMR